MPHLFAEGTRRSSRPPNIAGFNGATSQSMAGKGYGRDGRERGGKNGEGKEGGAEKGGRKGWGCVQPFLKFLALIPSTTEKKEINNNMQTDKAK